MSNDAIVQVTIPSDIKDRAVDVLERMGVTASDLVRLVFFRVAEEGTLPFSLEIPNQETREAIEELERGDGKAYATLEEMMKDLIK